MILISFFPHICHSLTFIMWVSQLYCKYLKKSWLFKPCFAFTVWKSASCPRCSNVKQEVSPIRVHSWSLLSWWLGIKSVWYTHHLNIISALVSLSSRHTSWYPRIVRVSQVDLHFLSAITAGLGGPSAVLSSMSFHLAVKAESHKHTNGLNGAEQKSSLKDKPPLVFVSYLTLGFFSSHM